MGTTRRPVVVLRRSSYFRRRAPVARRLRARGWSISAIARLLHLSHRRVRDALAGMSASGRLWTEAEREALRRELRRVTP